MGCCTSTRASQRRLREHQKSERADRNRRHRRAAETDRVLPALSLQPGASRLRHDRLHRGAGLAFRAAGLEAGDGDLDGRTGGQAGEHGFGFFGQFLGELGAGVVAVAGHLKEACTSCSELLRFR